MIENIFGHCITYLGTEKIKETVAQIFIIYYNKSYNLLKFIRKCFKSKIYEIEHLVFK